MSLENIKLEIISLGFSSVSEDEYYCQFEKPYTKYSKMFSCQVVLNWKLKLPLVCIYLNCKNGDNFSKKVVVDGYDLIDVGDFKKLLSRLTLILEPIQVF